MSEHHKPTTCGVDEGDFVLVTENDILFLGSDADDDCFLDESYDYCEDVFSHDFRVDDDGDGEVDNDDENEMHEAAADAGLSASVETQSSSIGLQDSSIILPLPALLMRDLDDAHAAAQLTGIGDLAESSGASTFTSKSELALSNPTAVLHTKEEGDDRLDKAEVGACPSKGFVVDCCLIEGNAKVGRLSCDDSSQEGGSKPKSSSTEGENTMDSLSPSSPTADSNETNQVGPTKTNSNTDDKIAASTTTVTTTVATTPSETNGAIKKANTVVEKTSVAQLSRASSKKRRKKLKSMKKAQASAHATKNISEKASDSSSPAKSSVLARGAKGKNSSSSKHRVVTPRSSKKAAGIAVICATETLTAYRNELLCAT